MSNRSFYVLVVVCLLTIGSRRAVATPRVAAVSPSVRVSVVLPDASEPVHGMLVEDVRPRWAVGPLRLLSSPTLYLQIVSGDGNQELVPLPTSISSKIKLYAATAVVQGLTEAYFVLYKRTVDHLLTHVDDRTGVAHVTISKVETGFTLATATTQAGRTQHPATWTSLPDLFAEHQRADRASRRSDVFRCLSAVAYSGMVHK